MTFERTHRVLDYDPDEGEYLATYDYPDEPPSVAVPLAVMELTDESLTDLDPLYTATDVDPDTLDELFRPAPGGVGGEPRVAFHYHGYGVTVKRYGRVVIRPETDE